MHIKDSQFKHATLYNIYMPLVGSRPIVESNFVHTEAAAADEKSPGAFTKKKVKVRCKGLLYDRTEDRTFFGITLCNFHFN